MRKPGRDIVKVLQSVRLRSNVGRGSSACTMLMTIERIILMLKWWEGGSVDESILTRLDIIDRLTQQSPNRENFTTAKPCVTLRFFDRTEEENSDNIYYVATFPIFTKIYLTKAR